jgi:hypothetical protein
MSEVWYRGQSSAAAPSKPGGSIHDFGDGLYLTNTPKVAGEYADLRVSEVGGRAQVLQLQVGRAELGRVLDLTADPRWTQYMNRPVMPGAQSPRQLIGGTNNEYYNQVFQGFLKAHKIDLKQYDAVIGPEYVRGGNQLCLLHKDGAPSATAEMVRSRLTPVGGSPAPAGNVKTPTSIVPSVPGKPLAELSRAKGILGNSNAMAMIGVALGGFLQSLGDWAIGRRVQELLATTNARAIQTILGTGQGVLVIIAMQEWEQPDYNGMRARALMGVSVHGGREQASALHSWQHMARLVEGAPKGGGGSSSMPGSIPLASARVTLSFWESEGALP